jgi:hypothetical protein
MAWIFQRRVDMDDLTEDLRIRIHYKLESGQLPYDSATKVSGRPATGETCAACDSAIDEGLVMECLVGAGGRTAWVRFHVLCFELWNDERRQPHKQTA